MSRSKARKSSDTTTVNLLREEEQLAIARWSAIPWKEVEMRVFKLQKRIFTASQNGNYKVVRKLQKTLMRSRSCRLLAVRQVTQDNKGKKTAGVDGKKSLTYNQRLELVESLSLSDKSSPTRRVWIPKPGKTEKRPLGIPTIHDRALQAVVKMAMEPEWEAVFEPSSYGFRPGRSVHDAIKQIKNNLISNQKFVLDADISKCFDKINHKALLEKTGQKGKIRRLLKSWLKSGVVDAGIFSKTEEGTPQGGIISPLLANIALHGIENMLVEYATNAKGWKGSTGYPLAKRDRINTLTFIRYADDFVVIHPSKEIILECKKLIEEWLIGIGLELKPSKTRIAHTLKPELSEDGKAGFDFLGFHIQQHKAGKHKSTKTSQKKPSGLITLITPTKEAVERHQKKLGEVIKALKHTGHTKLIIKLNPIIMGWSNYYRHSDIKNVRELSRQDYQLYLKLRSWGRHRCKGSEKASYTKYWHRQIYTDRFGNSHDRIMFSEVSSKDKPIRLEKHADIPCSSKDYIMVKGNRSPYDGDWIYWSTRMGQYHDTKPSLAKALKKQKGKCPHCGLYFKLGDILETDHIKPKSKGGKNQYSNLQVLHRHCHDVKTASDGSRSPVKRVNTRGAV